MNEYLHNFTNFSHNNVGLVLGRKLFEGGASSGHCGNSIACVISKRRSSLILAQFNAIMKTGRLTS